MEVEVYADLLFLINAGMDGLCFLLTGKLLHRRPSPGRLLAGAALGGIYAVVALLMNVGQAPAFALDVAVCFLMCLMVFGVRGRGGLRRLCGATALYVAVSMVMGGVMTALFHWLNRTGLTEHLPRGEEGLGTWLFVGLSLAGGVISLWGGRLARRSAAVRSCRVTVEMNGRRVELVGLVDTGNLLRDPIGGRPVICADIDALAPILSPTLLAVLRGGGPDLSALSGDPDAHRVRIIPAGGATGDGILPGVRPDRVVLTVEGDGRRSRATREVDAVIAATALRTTGSVTADPTGAEALVPAELVM